MNGTHLEISNYTENNLERQPKLDTLCKTLILDGDLARNMLILKEQKLLESPPIFPNRVQIPVPNQNTNKQFKV